MSTIVTRTAEIPDSPYGYVLATDRFMSGWGHAEGTDNVCVFPVDSAGQAERVMSALHDRDEMIRVRLVANKPRIRPSWTVSLFDTTATAFYGDDGPRCAHVNCTYRADRIDHGPLCPLNREHVREEV